MHAERCPVCGGNGLVPNGFYGQRGGQRTTTSTAPEACRSCGGAGFVCVPTDPPPPPLFMPKPDPEPDA